MIRRSGTIVTEDSIVRLSWMMSIVFALAALPAGVAAGPQNSVHRVKNVVLITDKLDISAKWENLLSAVGTDKFSSLLKLNRDLLFKESASVGFLFDKEALGLEKRTEFGEFMQSVNQLLGSGRNLENVKLSDLPGEIGDRIRQRFMFHKSVGLSGIDRANFSVSMSTGLTLTFDNGGKKVKLNFMFPYERPDRSAIVKQRPRPLIRPTASPGPLTRPRLQGDLVSHFSNMSLMSDVLMEYSSMAHHEAAELIRALATSNNILVEDFWNRSMDSKSDVEANAHNAREFQDLPDVVRDVLAESIGAAYEKYGFRSRADALDFLWLARIAHSDRKISFTVGYTIEGKSRGSRLTMSTTLDHR